MHEFLFFRRMITPVFIHIIFWIGAGLCVLFGLIAMFTGMTTSFGGGQQVFAGLLMIVLGPLAVRVYCELLIVLFRIHDSLEDIRRQGITRPM